VNRPAGGPPLGTEVTLRTLSGEVRVDATVASVSGPRLHLRVAAEAGPAAHSLVLLSWGEGDGHTSVDGCVGDGGRPGLVIVHLPGSPEYARRRAWARAADGLGVDLHTAEVVVPAYTVDVGGGGLRVLVLPPDELSRRRARRVHGGRSPGWFAPGEEIGVAVHLPAQRVVARAVVLSEVSTTEGWEVRLEFTELDEAARDRLLKRILERQRSVLRAADQPPGHAGGPAPDEGSGPDEGPGPAAPSPA